MNTGESFRDEAFFSPAGLVVERKNFLIKAKIMVRQ